MPHSFWRQVGRHLLVFALLLASVPATAQERDPAALDIAGIKLGMTLDQAMRALRAAGYGPKYNRQNLPLEQDSDVTWGESFALKAHAAAQDKLGIQLPNRPLAKAIVGVQGAAANGSEITIAFWDWPDGPRVHSIIFRGGPQMVDRAAELDQLARSKYGPPTATIEKMHEFRDYWCSPGVRKCDDTISDKARLILERTKIGRRNLTLYIGDQEDSRLHALAKAEGAKIAAAVVKSGQGPVQVVAGSAADAARRDPSTFDVAGVKLDMTPEQAAAAMIAAGYRQSTSFPPQYDLTFEQRVQLQADRRNGLNPDLPKGQGVQLLTFEHGSGGQVRVGFINLREGARVNSVLYQVESDSTDLRAFRQRVDAKYGPPTLSRSTDDVWCAKIGTQCGYQDVSLSASRISVERGFVTISLRDDEMAGSKKLHAAVEAEVFKRTGKY